MSSEILPVTGQPPIVDVPPDISTTSVTQAAVGTTQISIASMADLKTASPQLYNAITRGVFMRIKHQMDASQERIKKILDEAKRN